MWSNIDQIIRGIILEIISNIFKRSKDSKLIILECEYK